MTFQNYKLANNAKTTVASAIMAGGTSLTCATWEGDRFPTTYPYFLTLEKTVNNIVTKKEVVLVTNKTGDTFDITRSAWYCPASATATTQTNTAFAFDAWDTIQLRFVAENIDDINAELVRLGLVLYPDATASAKGVVKLTVAPTRSLWTATITIASPAVIGRGSHGLVANDAIKFTTSGTLPTGIVADTIYYVSATGLTGNTFQVSATVWGASIVTTGSQVGTHTLYNVTGYAVGDNDTRMPTAGEKLALAGSYGTPGSGNKFVTEDDPLYTNNIKTTGDQNVAGVKTFSSIPVLPATDATTANQAVRKAQVDDMIADAIYDDWAAHSVVDWSETIYYRRRGKMLYSMWIFNPNVDFWLYGDIDTANRIATLLSWTVSSWTSTYPSWNFSGSFSTYRWNWSAWVSISTNVWRLLTSITLA